MIKETGCVFCNVYDHLLSLYIFRFKQFGIAVGGMENTGGGGTPTSDVQIYNVKEHTWFVLLMY